MNCEDVSVEDVSFNAEPEAGYATPAGIAAAKSPMSARDALLIATSWGALASFVVYPELQLMAFCATVSGVVLLGRAGKDI